MDLTILFGVFTALMLIGTPIAFCLGIASFATVLYLGLPPLVVFQRLASGVSVFTLMAIPFFIYAGDLMVRGGIASRIVAFAGSLIGHVRGGLGQVNIAASTLFGGISGSAVAEAAAVGGIMIPQMKARGYGADYAVNVTSMAALIALLLPPSLVAGNLCVAHAGHLARQAGLDQFVLGAQLRQDDVRLAQRIARERRGGLQACHEGDGHDAERHQDLHQREAALGRARGAVPVREGARVLPGVH